jgi:DNA polymerase-3 subunit gamma/tau
VLTAVRRKSVKSWAVAREATVRDVQGGTLFLLFQHQVHANMLSNDTKTLTDAVAEMVGGRWQIKCEIAGQGPPPGAPPAQAQPPPQPTGPPPSQPDRAGARHPATATTGDDGWPTAAVPGGGRAGTTTAPAPSAAMPAARPTTSQAARPAPAQAAVPAPEAPARAPAQAASAQPAAPAQPAQHATPQTQPGPGVAAARQAAAAAASRPASARVAAPAAAAPQAAPASWGEEPPVYESDYGFDPGDEPADEDEPVVRESSEEQALRLLREHLGAERID